MEVAHAQAWVPEQGLLGGGVSYQYDTSDKIVQEGDEFGGGVTTVQTVTLDLEYVPLERLAASAAMPLVAARFDGDGVGDGSGVFPHGRWDDGDTHVALSDFRFDVRYAVVEEILALSPQVGVSVPVGDYETLGLTAPGRGLKQLHLGLAIGRSLEPFLPDLYIQAAYEYSLVEKVDIDAATEAISQDKSRFGAQVAYLIIPTLMVNVAFDGVMHHDGVTFDDISQAPASVQNYHDALLKEEALLLGGGITYDLTDNVGLGIAYRQFISGNNTRAPRIFAASLSWTFPVGPAPAGQSSDGTKVARSETD